MLIQEKVSSSRVPLKAVIWLFPLVFLIHDMEELLRFESWLGNLESTDTRGLPIAEWGSVIWTTPRLAAAIAVLFALICAACYFATRTESAKHRKWYVIGIAVLFVNVFTHLAQTLLAGMYTPGVVTAVVVGLPYAYYALHRLVSEGWIMRAFTRVLLVIAAAVLAAGVIGAAML